MTLPNENKEQCGQCKHWDDLGRWVRIDYSTVGECVCERSDHKGHFISPDHCACSEYQERK